jgi:hypothetical protein
MRVVNNEVRNRRPYQAVGVGLLIAVLTLCAGAGHAQTPDPGAQSCVDLFGWAACSGAHGPIPDIVNDLWNAIAYSPSHNIAAFAGSYTAPENAKAAAMKGCAARASDCRIVVAAHDICVAVAYQRSAGGQYRAAIGVTKQDAEGKALPVCLAEGPKRCAVMARCTGTPPILSVTQ